MKWWEFWTTSCFLAMIQCSSVLTLPSSKNWRALWDSSVSTMMQLNRSLILDGYDVCRDSNRQKRSQQPTKPSLTQLGLGEFGTHIIWLVVSTPLKIWKSVGMIIPNIWKNKTCSKPPTRYILCIYIYKYIYIYINTYTAGWDITPLCSLTWEINRVLAPGSISIPIFPCWKCGEKPTMPIYSHHFRYIYINGYLRVYRVYRTSKHTSFCHVLPISSRRQMAISIMFLHQTWFPNRKWHLLESPPSHFPGRGYGSARLILKGG